MPTDSFFFTALAVILALIVMVLSARLIMRVAIFLISVLVIWYCLAYVGLVEAPEQFFKAYEFKKPLETPLQQKERWGRMSVQELERRDAPGRSR